MSEGGPQRDDGLGCMISAGAVQSVRYYNVYGYGILT